MHTQTILQSAAQAAAPVERSTGGAHVVRAGAVAKRFGEGASAVDALRGIDIASVITAVIGGLLGTAIGLLFSWLTTYALSDLGLVFEIPAGQLAALAVVAVVVRVPGAIVPARRVARVDILPAVSAGE